ncbi:hypothetical protein HK100_010838, partial [Physocladia obscura]
YIVIIGDTVFTTNFMTSIKLTGFEYVYLGVNGVTNETVLATLKNGFINISGQEDITVNPNITAAINAFAKLPAGDLPGINFAYDCAMMMLLGFDK